MNITDMNIDFLNNYLNDITKKGDGSIIGNYTSSIGKVIQIKIVFPKHFPTSLPKFFILNKSKLELFIPHLEDNGLICYTSSSNIIFDNSKPDKILESSIKKAIMTVEEGFKKINKEDFRKEFIAFWDQQKELTGVNFFATADDSIKTLDIASSGNNLIVKDTSPIQNVPIERFFTKNLIEFKNIEALYVPIRYSNEILPPNPHKGWSRNELLNIVRKNTTQSVKKQFNRWIKRKPTKQRMLFLKIPIDAQNEVIIGFHFKHKEPLKTYAGPIIPLLVVRYDLKYLLERTSGEHQYTNLDICIVGLGSVGSKLSNELAKMGVNKMTLVDPDKFDKDNLFRHSLGADSLKDGIRNFKVDELQTELERKNPYLEVNVESMNVLDIIYSLPNYFDQFDYVFLCIGDTMTSLELNTFFYQKEVKYKVFYTWVEPLGVGGHILYIDYSKKGCFSCLNTDIESGNIISNRSSFIAPGQHIEKQLASCRSAFIPYGSLTSSEAALRTTTFLHKVINNNIKENSILSWVGNTDMFERMGYKFSSRFLSHRSNFPTIENNFLNIKCKVCGDHHDNILQ